MIKHIGETALSQRELDNLVHSIASSSEQLRGPERRRFLKSGLVLAGAAAGASLSARAEEVGVPPNVLHAETDRATRHVPRQPDALA